MIKVHIPDNNINERKYIVDVMISDFLGLEYELVLGCDNWEIDLGNGKLLEFEDHFFSKYPKDLEYLNIDNIPLSIEYVKNKFTPENDIPVIYGSDKLEISEDTIVCGIDIFASSFFMLTRWEEYVNRTRDIHDRFPARESIATKYGFIDRPVVNEYLEMLWNMMRYFSPKLERKKRQFKLVLTHDVDVPFRELFRSKQLAARRFVGDIVKRHSLVLAVKTLKKWRDVRSGQLVSDPYYTFDFIMNESEKRKINSAFYFLVEGSPESSLKYSINDKTIQKLIIDIHKRGHEIGLHTSYYTYLDKDRTLYEAQSLRQTLLKLGIKQVLYGGRQHYLRWEVPETFQNWENASLVYDSTLTYSELAGFRCGICYEFRTFNIITRLRLNLIERPLIVMECSIISDLYVGLGLTIKAYDRFKSLKDTCRRYNGDFTLLWHNSELGTKERRKFYLQILDS